MRISSTRWWTQTPSISAHNERVGKFWTGRIRIRYTLDQYPHSISITPKQARVLAQQLTHCADKAEANGKAV